MNLDPVRWLQEKANKAQEQRDSKEVVTVYKKMLSMAHGRPEILRQAHQGLADAYAELGDLARMRRHQRECLTVEQPSSEQGGIPWIGDEERWLDYEDYRQKSPSVLLPFPEWRALDDEMLLLLAWSNLRELKPVEAGRLSYLRRCLLVE